MIRFEPLWSMTGSPQKGCGNIAAIGCGIFMKLCRWQSIPAMSECDSKCRRANKIEIDRRRRELPAVLNQAEALDSTVVTKRQAEVWRRPALPEGRPRWGRSGRW